VNKRVLLAYAVAVSLVLAATGGQPVQPVSAAARPVDSFLAAGGQSITVNPQVLDWGTVVPGGGPYGVGVDEVVIYVNSSSAPAPIFQTLNIVGPNASEFYVTNNGCAGQVQFGCGIWLAFWPSPGSGPRTATLQIYDDQAGSPQTVALKANVAAAGALVNPTLLNFGSVPAGTTSAPQTLTVKSTGTSALNISSLTFNGSVSLFNKLNDTCTGTSLAPGTTCTVQVTYGPNQAAYSQSSDALTVNSNSPAHATAGLFANGVGTPSVGALLSLAFGGLNVGVTSTAKVPIHNSGNANLVVSSDTITGANTSNFVIASDTCVKAAVAPADSCEIDVSAHADSAGTSYSASLTLNDNTNTSDVIALSAKGVTASDSISATSLNFGTVALGATGTRTITLSSNGPDPLSESGSYLTGASPGDFAVSDACTGASTPSGSTCTITVNLTPNTNGGIAPTATLTVNDSAGSHQVALTGAVSGSGIFYSANPLQFGIVAKGSSVTLGETVFNETGASFTISNVFPAGDTTITSDTCTGAPVANGSSCSFNVVYSPTASGPHSSQVVLVTASGTPSFPRITTTGNGLVAYPNPNPFYTTFPNTPVHGSSQQTVTFTNVGTADWVVTSVNLSDTTNFGVVPNTDQCSGKSIAPNASCTITFAFTPTKSGGFIADLSQVSNVPSWGIFPQLQGIAIMPWAGMAPTLSMGSQEVGRTVTATIAVRNIMEADLHVTGATFSGGAPPGVFSVTSQNCQLVPRGASCQIQVQFAPQLVGLVNTTLTLVDDEVSPKTVLLSGNGLQAGVCSGGILGASPSPTAGIGTNVAFYASAVCGLPLYKFLLQSPGSSTPVIVQDWGVSSTWTWETAGLATGTYTVTVQIKDQNSTTTTFDTTATTTEQLAYAPCGAATLSADHFSPSQRGGTIVLSSSTSGCGSPRYQFWILPPGSSTWLVAQLYSPSDTYMWNTTAWAPGTYMFIVWARDAHSPGTSGNVLGTWDAYASLSFTITLTPTCSLLGGQVSPAGSATWGQLVSMSVGSRNCPNPQYQFWILPPGSSTWLVAQFYSSNFMFGWNTGRYPNPWIGGTYRFVVWARDASSPGLYSNSFGSWDTYLMFSYYLQPLPCTSVNVNYQWQGPTLTLSAQATGCPNPSYEFWVLYPGASTWSLYQVYSTNPNFSFNFIGGPPGRYYFSIWARDASSSGVSSVPGYGTYDAYLEAYTDR
jgi:hypothetical protein